MVKLVEGVKYNDKKRKSKKLDLVYNHLFKESDLCKTNHLAHVDVLMLLEVLLKKFEKIEHIENKIYKLLLIESDNEMEDDTQVAVFPDTTGKKRKRKKDEDKKQKKKKRQ